MEYIGRNKFIPTGNSVSRKTEKATNTTSGHFETVVTVQFAVIPERRLTITDLGTIFENDQHSCDVEPVPLKEIMGYSKMESNSYENLYPYADYLEQFLNECSDSAC